MTETIGFFIMAPLAVGPNPLYGHQSVVPLGTH
jgi:hypothetical protein